MVSTNADKSLLKLIIILIIGLIFIFVIMPKLRKIASKEEWGVFSHRSTLHGIKNQTRNHYTLQELDIRNPSDYWDKNNQDLSIYDKHVKSYHAKRLDPKLIQ